jgi:hypothetical protein
MVLPALAIAALLMGAVGTVAAATPGYAAYSVQLSYGGTTHSLIVNESVAATSSASQDRLAVGIVYGGSDLNYSRSINSSEDVSPFLPSISNQSLSYTSGSTSATVSVAKNGSDSIQFHGSSYALTSYALAVGLTSNGTSQTIAGAVAAFPSGLVYSVKLAAQIPTLGGLTGLGEQNFTIPGLTGLTGLGGLTGDSLQIPGLNSTMGLGSLLGLTTESEVTLTVTLLSTSLPLTVAGSSTMDQAASVGIGAGAVVSVLALGLGVRHRRSHPAAQGPKPDYAVD